MDFKKRMDEIIDKGIEGTKDLWGKAKEKARDLSQKGILTFEISQLERQAQTELAKLGTLVYDALASRKAPSINSEDPDVKKALDSLQGINAKIDAKEEELRKLREKGS